MPEPEKCPADASPDPWANLLEWSEAALDCLICYPSDFPGVIAHLAEAIKRAKAARR